MTPALILAAVVLAFVLGFILCVRSGAQQTADQLLAKARAMRVQRLATGEAPQDRREADQGSERP